MSTLKQCPQWFQTPLQMAVPSLVSYFSV